MPGLVTTVERASGAARRDGVAQLQVVRLPVMDFMEGCRMQSDYAEARRTGTIGDTLLLARHPHTYCTGVLGKDRNVLIGEADRQTLGVPYYRVDRGGDVMYLGPGHLVAYPIVSLGSHGLDPISYLRTLEEVVIRTLGEHGVQAGRFHGLTGVWAGEAKIAGVAVKVSRGVTTFGFNVNVNPDLSFYRHIVTCGNVGREVTSMERLLDRAPQLREVEDSVVRHFTGLLGLREPDRRSTKAIENLIDRKEVGEVVEYLLPHHRDTPLAWWFDMLNDGKYLDAQ